MIKIYSTDTCPYCDKAKLYLKKLNKDYIELNVAEDMEAREEMVKKSNQMGVPVLDINGTIIVGFDKILIDNALNL